MQNHAPYRRDQYAQYDISLSSAIPGLKQDELAAFTQGVYDGDRSTKRLIEHFSASKEPVVFLAFGDHLPAFGDVFLATGFQKAEEEIKPDVVQRMRERVTPGLLWTNMPEPLPKMPPVVSPNFFTPTLLEITGITDPYFTTFLSRGRDLCPGLTHTVCAGPNGKPVLDPPDEARRFLYEYELLQYDILLGDRYAQPLFASRPSGAAGNQPAAQAPTPAQNGTTRPD
jgi:hypothetical protein